MCNHYYQNESCHVESPTENHWRSTGKCYCYATMTVPLKWQTQRFIWTVSCEVVCSHFQKYSFDGCIAVRTAELSLCFVLIILLVTMPFCCLHKSFLKNIFVTFIEIGPLVQIVHCFLRLLVFCKASFSFMLYSYNIKIISCNQKRFSSIRVLCCNDWMISLLMVWKWCCILWNFQSVTWIPHGFVKVYKNMKKNLNELMWR